MAKDGDKTAQPDAALSRDRIAAAAVAMLDQKGLNGLTMRGLAETLGSGVMSLYWHVPNKDALLDLALDAVLDYGAPAPSEDWREAVAHLVEDWRATMLRHPWSAALLPQRALGMNMLKRLELLSTIFSRAGVDDKDMNIAIWSVWNYVMGATVTRMSFPAPGDKNAPALGEAFPALNRTQLLEEDDWDGVFRQGLERLLDGLTRP